MKNRLLWVMALGCAFALCGCDESSSISSEPGDGCQPSETKCDGNTLSVCGNDGKWVVFQTCEGNTPICDTASKSCVSNSCTPDTAKCDGNALSICGSDGKWGASTTCTGDTPICDAASKSCKQDSCTPDTAKCDDNVLSICGSDGKWGTSTTCTGDTPICDVATKSCKQDSCTPDTAKCDDNVLSICGSDGKWGTPTICTGDTPICDTASKSCKQNSCAPNEAKCDGNVLTICGSDGKWGTSIQCTGNTPKCDINLKSCVACLVGESKCQGNSLSTCDSSGNWIDSKNCEVSSSTPFCSAELNACVACHPGVPVCSGSGKSAGMRKCTEKGEIGELIDYCPFGCAKDRTACNNSDNECNTGAYQCSDDKTGIVGCVNNKWDYDHQKKCDAGLTCDSLDNGTVECNCKPGSEVCAYVESRARGMYICTDKGTLPPANNKPGLVAYCDCTPDGCPCKPEGSRSCVMSGLSICQNGFWTQDKTKVCNKSQTCSEAAGGVCIPWNLCNQDEMICDGDKLMTCNNGFFEETEDCTSLGKGSYCITSYKNGTRTAGCSQKPVNTQTCHTGDPWTFDKLGNPKHITCSDSERCLLSEQPTQIPEETLVVAKCVKTVCIDNTFSCSKSGVLSVCRNNSYQTVADCSEYGLTCDAKQGKCLKK